ncbi:MAG: diacylglycerol kinase family protein [Planctomycetaceae bacterium]
MMNANSRFTFSSRLNSFRYAFRGIAVLLVSEPNSRIHALATFLVTIAGWYVGLSRFEWCWIVAAIFAVWTTEAFNTAIESLTDLVSPEFHPLAEKTKDIASAAVLLTAIGAAIIGLMIFLPHILD